MELIKITEHEGKKAVSAKELHLFVDMLTRFDIWIMRMLEYGFIEHVDYQCLYKNVQMPNGGAKQAIEDYALSLECAKEISMLQRNEKGKQARTYFIEMEKKALELSKPKELSRKELALMIVEAETARELAEEKIKELEPKAEIFEQIVNAENNLTLNEAAKTIGIGRNLMMQKLRQWKILLGNNTPFQSHIDNGYFIVKLKTIPHLGTNYPQTYVTGKGLIWLTKLLKY